MAKAKKGDLLSCQVCGLIVTVDEACNCAVSEIVCCDEPMAKGKMAAGKARKVAAPAVKAPAKAKAAVKAKAKAKPKAAKAKPAAKKAVAKKPAAKAKKK